VDAAVSMTLCAGVTSPQSGGLGGGLFMVIYTGNETHAVNARETAPDTVDPSVYDDNPTASRSG
jgi:gamma-glutamyltranspeptidase